MALISYGIQLTSTPVNSGPVYAVSYSTNCTTYTYAGTVSLPTTASIATASIEETSTCIKLVSLGDCTNEVVSGSSPSSSSYHTAKVTLTEKNGAGPNFILSENTGSLYTYVANIELAAGGHYTWEAGTPLNAVRLRSQGVCTNQVDVQVEFVPTPTPSPTPGPTPTPGPVTPTPIPTSAPVSCYGYVAYNTGSSAGSSVTFTGCMDSVSYTFSNLANDAYYFVSKTTPTTTGDAYVTGPFGYQEPWNGFSSGSWDETRVQPLEFRTGGDRAIVQYYDNDVCAFVTGSILSNFTSIFVNAVSGSQIEFGIPTVNRGTVTTGGTCQIPGPTPTPPPVTPTPTPPPTPSTCYTFYTIYASTLSATEACCNITSPVPVYLNASSLATATAVYTDNTCSTLRSTPTYYTQNLTDYYYWTGASLVGPTSCPGCP